MSSLPRLAVCPSRQKASPHRKRNKTHFYQLELCFGYYRLDELPRSKVLHIESRWIRIEISRSKEERGSLEYENLIARRLKASAEEKLIGTGDGRKLISKKYIIG